MPRDRWAVVLDCGHEARIPGLPPEPGQWLTCPDGSCQGQRRVAAVRAVPVMYVQEALL